MRVRSALGTCPPTKSLYLTGAVAPGRRMSESSVSVIGVDAGVPLAGAAGLRDPPPLASPPGRVPSAIMRASLLEWIPECWTAGEGRRARSGHSAFASASDGCGPHWNGSVVGSQPDGRGEGSDLLRR